jgi:hypothetical protein
MWLERVALAQSRQSYPNIHRWVPSMNKTVLPIPIANAATASKLEDLYCE